MAPFTTGLASCQKLMRLTFLGCASIVERTSHDGQQRMSGINGTFQSARKLIGEAARAARDQIELARVATRLGMHSGLAYHLTPRGVLALARSRAGGSLGLASLFRIHAA